MGNVGSASEYRAWLDESELRGLDEMLHTFEGIVRGVAIDNVVNQQEAEAVIKWAAVHDRLRKFHPFDSLLSAFDRIMADGRIDPAEARRLVDLCRQARAETVFHLSVANGLQVVRGVIRGIICDGVVTEAERKGLVNWMDNNPHLDGYYPFDEIKSIAESCSETGKLDDGAHETLLSIFSGIEASVKCADGTAIKNPFGIMGVCAFMPRITFDMCVFCLTGKFKKPRAAVEQMIVERNGEVRTTMTSNVDYLVVGQDGSPHWAYKCYGRKIHNAMDLRRQGYRVKLVAEVDFWERIESE